MLIEYITRADVLAGGDSFAALYGVPPGGAKASEEAVRDIIEEVKAARAWDVGCRVMGAIQLRKLRRLPKYGTFPGGVTPEIELFGLISSRAWALGTLLTRSSNSRS